MRITLVYEIGNATAATRKNKRCVCVLRGWLAEALELRQNNSWSGAMMELCHCGMHDHLTEITFHLLTVIAVNLPAQTADLKLILQCAALIQLTAPPATRN
jgi:hypothetical protein